MHTQRCVTVFESYLKFLEVLFLPCHAGHAASPQQMITAVHWTAAKEPKLFCCHEVPWSANSGSIFLQGEVIKGLFSLSLSLTEMKQWSSLTENRCAKRDLELLWIVNCVSRDLICSSCQSAEEGHRNIILLLLFLLLLLPSFFSSSFFLLLLHYIWSAKARGTLQSTLRINDQGRWLTHPWFPWIGNKWPTTEFFNISEHRILMSLSNN